MPHPFYSDGRYHGPDIDLKTDLELLFEKYGVNVVFCWPRQGCGRLKPEHGIYYFALGNSGEWRYRNPKASPEMATGLAPIRAFGGRDRRPRAVFLESFANGTVVDSGGLISRVRRRRTRSSFTSPREEFR